MKMFYTAGKTESFWIVLLPSTIFFYSSPNFLDEQCVTNMVFLLSA